MGPRCSYLWCSRNTSWTQEFDKASQRTSQGLLRTKFSSKLAFLYLDQETSRLPSRKNHHIASLTINSKLLEVLGTSCCCGEGGKIVVHRGYSVLRHLSSGIIPVMSRNNMGCVECEICECSVSVPVLWACLLWIEVSWLMVWQNHTALVCRSLRKGSMMLREWSWSLPGNNGQFPASPTDTEVTKPCDWKLCSSPQCSRTQVSFMSWMSIRTQLPFFSSFPSSHFSSPKSLQLIHFNLFSWVLNASSPAFARIFSGSIFLSVLSSRQDNPLLCDSANVTSCCRANL